ncbi:MAG TPA: cupin domain-containing protein [Nocardioidaceae bacterium]|nr:cupin domain-containing protein [Nocardioidaceae bacterium]
MTGPNAAPDEHKSTMVWVPPGGGRQVRRLNGEDTAVLADGSVTDDAYAVRLNTAPPQFQNVPLHVHRAAEEAFYVLSGTLAVVADGRRLDAIAGSFVLIPRGTPHSLANLTDVPTVFMTLISPGHQSGWIDAEAALLERSEPGPIDTDELADIHRRFGLELLGPPPDWSRATPDGSR